MDNTPTVPSGLSPLDSKVSKDSKDSKGSKNLNPFNPLQPWDLLIFFSESNQMPPSPLNPPSKEFSQTETFQKIMGTLPKVPKTGWLDHDLYQTFTCPLNQKGARPSKKNKEKNPDTLYLVFPKLLFQGLSPFNQFFSQINLEQIFKLSSQFGRYLDLLKKSGFFNSTELTLKEFFTLVFTTNQSIESLSLNSLKMLKPFHKSKTLFSEPQTPNQFFLELEKALKHQGDTFGVPIQLAFHSEISHGVPQKDYDYLIPWVAGKLLQETLVTLIKNTKTKGIFQAEINFKGTEIKVFFSGDPFKLSPRGWENIQEGNLLSNSSHEESGSDPLLFNIFFIFKELGIPFRFNRISEKGLQGTFTLHLIRESPGKWNLKQYSEELLTRLKEVGIDSQPNRNLKGGGGGSVKEYSPPGALAQKVQECFLPKRVPKFPGSFVRGGLVPSGQCGGDHFHFFQPGSGCLVIFHANIQTKTLYSALLLAIIHSLASEICTSESRAMNYLQELNRKLKPYVNPLEENQISGQFLVFFNNKMDKNSLSFARAGTGNAALFPRKNSDDSGKKPKNFDLFCSENSDFLGLKNEPSFFNLESEVEIDDLIFSFSTGFMDTLKKGSPEDPLVQLNGALFNSGSGSSPEILLKTVLDFANDQKGRQNLAEKSDLDLSAVLLKITDQHSFSYAIPSQLENISEVTSIVLRYADNFGLDSQSIYHLKLAVHEAVVNAIEHGNRFDPQKLVNVDFQLRPEKFVIKIRDEGSGFTLDGVSNPVDPENVWKEGGRGIFLIQQLMDELFLNKDGNELTMVKYLSDELTK